MLVGAASAGSGAGNYLPAMILFPFAMLAVRAFELHYVYLVILAVLQFPIYGTVLGYGNQKRGFVLAMLAVMFAHGGAVWLVLRLAHRAAW
jgi:hypothetical protein